MKKSISQSPLLMDHFYRVISGTAFEEAKRIVEIFPNAEHRVSDTNYGKWEGIYLMTSSGAYIEFIRQDQYWNPYFVSMCTSFYGDEDQLFEQVREAYTEHKFTLSEINRPNGDPWLFCTMLEAEEKGIYFYAEEYWEREKELRKQKGKTDNNWLATVDYLDCLANFEQYQVLSSSANWFAKKVDSGKERIKITIPQMNHEDFIMTISHTKQSSRPFEIGGTYDESLFSERSLSNHGEFKYFRISFEKANWSIIYLGTPNEIGTTDEAS